MACTSTDICYKSFYKVFVQLSCIRWCQVMRNHNYFFVDRSWVWQFLTKKVCQYTFCHVANIRCTFLHVWIVFHAFKDSDEHVSHFFKTCFCIDFLSTDCFFNLTNQFWVRKNHQMSVKNLSRFFTKRTYSLLTDKRKLVLRSFKSYIQTSLFCVCIFD